MLTIHKTQIVSKCPHGCTDIYEAEFYVTTSMVLEVEAIQEAIDDLTKEPVFQEDLTRRLSSRLKCHVVTRGRHGRFTTECRTDVVSNPMLVFDK